MSPFALAGEIGAGTVMWSNVIAGLAVLVLAAYAGYDLHSSE